MEEIMKSALFKIGLSLLAMVFMASCSGSGKEGSSTNVTLKIGTADSAHKKSFLGLPLVTASAIPSIVKKITITITAADITTISQSFPITSSTLSRVTTFSVPNGSARVITVTAEDNYGNIPYKASSPPLDMDGTDKSVQIQMVEDIKAAITARLMLYFKDAMASKIQAGTLAAADLDPFYVSAALYGVNNGSTRDLVIAEDVKDFSRTFLRKTMSTIQIDPPLPDSQNLKYTVTGKGTFSDGSYGFPGEGFVMMKENGEWKFAGNGFKSDIEFGSASYRWLESGVTSPFTLTGLEISVREKIDPAGTASPLIHFATVSGPGLGTGVELLRSSAVSGPSPDLHFSSNPCFSSIPSIPSVPNAPNVPTQFFISNELYCLPDATITSIPANSTYTFTLRDINNAVIETRSFKLPVRPYTSAELTSAHFPGLSIPAAYPATDGHALADARIGGASGLTMTLSKPTAFAPSWLEAEFHYNGWFGTVNNGFFIDRDLLLSDTSTTFASLLPSLLINSIASVTAEDFDNRRETRTFWTFNGPKFPGPVSFFATSNSQLTNGVTQPASGTVWKFGDPPPTISWSGFPSSFDNLDIYLLADDPSKVLSPATIGNPFPNVIWSKLNPSPVPSSFTGSFPAGSPELLGVTGSACRVLIVAFNSGMWAISPPFYIGP